MARVLITTDHGQVTLDERVQADDFGGEHFRSCLVDRLRWATEDAEHPDPGPDTDDRHDRFFVPAGVGSGRGAPV